MSDTNSEPGQIEENLENVRSRLDHRLNELQDRLAPRQIAGDFMEYFRQGGGGDFARNLVDTMRRNPLPVVVAGIGLAWLMASQAASDSTRAADDGGMRRAANGMQGADYDFQNDSGAGAGMRESVTGMAGTVKDKVAAGKEKLMGTAHDVKDRLTGGGGTMSDAAQRAAERMSEGMRSVSHSGGLMSAVTGQPLVLGALGLAAGMVLGLLVPTSGYEDEALGGVAAGAREQVQDAAQEIVERGGRVARKMMDEVKSGGRAEEEPEKRVEREGEERGAAAERSAKRAAVPAAGAGTAPLAEPPKP